MWIKKYWPRYSYRLAKRLRARENNTQPTLESISFLLGHLSGLLPHLLKITDWKNSLLVSQWRSIDGFLQHVVTATAIIKTKGDVLEPRHLLDYPRSIRLYDFFVTEDRLPLTLQEVTVTLETVLTAFLNALREVEASDDYRYRYYLRRYFHLIEAAHSFVQGLCDLATRE